MSDKLKKDNLQNLQAKFVVGAAALLPFTPLLLLQGQITRWKIGVLPDADGPRHGRYGAGSSKDANPAKLYVTGESTVAGLGARTHELALAGQFAKYLSEHIGRSAIGK